MKFNFTTREQYLEQAAAWKQEYKALSAIIREWKIKYRKAQSTEDTGGTPELAAWRCLANLRESQADAREMLDARAESKIEAGRQRRAALELKTA